MNHIQGGSKKINTGSLIVVDVDALQLQVGVAVIGASWINAMLIRNHLPELSVNKQLDLSYGQQ